MSQELSSLASEVGMVEFAERFGILKKLRNIWAAGGKAEVLCLEEKGKIDVAS